MNPNVDAWRETARRPLKRGYYAARRAILLGAGRLFRGSTARPIADASVRRVLFLRFDRIGDMVLSTPALMALKAHFPAARLTVLSGSANHGVLDNHPAVDEVIVFDDRFLRHPLRFLRQLNALRRRRFDLAVDPLIGADVKSAAVAFASRAFLRVGFRGAGREVFFNRPAPSPDCGRHFVDATLDLIKTVGVRAEEHTPRLNPRRGHIDWARGWIAAHTVAGLPVIGVHPGAHYPSQRWPAGHYARLIEAVHRELPGQAVVIGGPGDRASTQTIAASAKVPVPVYTGGDLGRSFALIAQCDVLVCNNSGPLHAAAALGVPTVSFMGPTHASRWWPRGGRHRVLRAEGLACLGCETGRCPRGDHACLQRISPATALACIRALLCQRALPTGTSPLKLSAA
jgi:lipopolysaccharide heptosyltransferase II